MRHTLKLGTVATPLALAALLGLAVAGHAPGAAAAAPAPVALSGQFGTTALTPQACFKRAKAALTRQKLVVVFAQTFDYLGLPNSVAVGETGKHIKVAIKCVGGAPGGGSFFSVDAASTVPGAGDLAQKVTDGLLPANELSAARSAAGGSRGPGKY
jgi:hypothetical protein